VSAPTKLGLPVSASEVVASIAQHRVLSTPQVQAIHFPANRPRWAQRVLARLRDAGLVDFVPNLGVPGAPRRLWFATERGARVAVEGGVLEARPRLYGAEAASGPLQAHTLALNEAAICFARAARERGDDFGPLAWRHEVALRLGGGRRAKTIFADAVLTYLRLTDSAVVIEQRFVELDRATLSVDRLAAELARYGRYLRARGKQGELLWEAQHPYFPPVLCVLAGGTRGALERRRDTAIVLLRADPEFTGAAELSVRICLLEDLIERGPFAPIFTDARDPEGPVDWLVPEPEGEG
jgi:Replication-relaxation